MDTFRTAVRGDPGADPARLNPNFRYLRVTVDGRIAYLALGYVEDHPQGPVEVWYSARREVLRLQNGRIIGALGLVTEWREVSLPKLPSWSTLADTSEPYRWIRTRDVMPGYRFGLRDALVLQKVGPPERSSLVGLDANRLTWFEERFQLEQLAGVKVGAQIPEDRMLPPARYAVDLREGREFVVYGEQCLAPELCFAWQRWAASRP